MVIRKTVAVAGVLISMWTVSAVSSLPVAAKTAAPCTTAACEQRRTMAAEQKAERQRLAAEQKAQRAEMRDRQRAERQAAAAARKADRQNNRTQTAR
jgi:hypothetical protein